MSAANREGSRGSRLWAVGRAVLILLFTAVEVIVLGVWLELVRDEPVASQAAAIGIAVLAAGLVVEHVLTDLAVNGLDISFPVGRVTLISVSEAALWAVWLVIAEEIGGIRGVAAAGVVLAVLLVPQHTIEDSVLRGEGLLSDLLDAGTVGFSLVEAAGATVWLALVFELQAVDPLASAAADAGVEAATAGLAALALALLVEHVVGVRFSRRAASQPTGDSSGVGRRPGVR